MINLMASLSLVVVADRNLSYAEVEDALNAQGFLGDSYLIGLSHIGGKTEANLTLTMPTSAITAEGVPRLPAVQMLRAAADALEILDT